MTRPEPSRLLPRDVLRTGASGLRARRARAFLSALGIAIGIAAMVSVLGISASSRAEVDRELAALGTDLLTVAPGRTMFGEDAELPAEAVAMISRIGPVERVAATGAVSGAKAYRSDRIPEGESGGLSVHAAQLDLLGTVAAETASGTWLNAATARHPTAVLGAETADRLGVGSPGSRILVGGVWFTVVGVLEPVPLAPELDTAVLVGWPAAQELLGFEGRPTTVYTRSEDDRVEAVRGVLAATANPEAPSEVEVSRPSDALAAREAADRAFTGLLLGLGAVALLVGGVGVANTMIISVLERRAEIGLRRSLGATRRHVLLQFLTESLLLSALGGLGGVLLSTAITALYAVSRGWPVAIPVWTPAAALGATLVIGALAGLYPATRAARMAPTEALSTP
ncbi:ABC transporter permease [Actinocorallia libanotica]|uniref:ABC transporter permease n=1 Tax=Actinocorallia libanotica TaxID=46162 RepID=A0ABN1RPS2_9ACTN